MLAIVGPCLILFSFGWHEIVLGCGLHVISLEFWRLLFSFHCDERRLNVENLGCGLDFILICAWCVTRKLLILMITKSGAILRWPVKGSFLCKSMKLFRYFCSTQIFMICDGFACKNLSKLFLKCVNELIAYMSTSEDEIESLNGLGWAQWELFIWDEFTTTIAFWFNNTMSRGIKL